MEQKKQVRISVRALVEFVLRSGDIDNRRSGAAQKDAMAAGTRIHKKIQKRMGGNYRAEVPLKYAALDEEEDIELLVEGRADGIFEEDGIVTIDEIKGGIWIWSGLQSRWRCIWPRPCATDIFTAATGIWTVCGSSLPTVIWRPRRSAGSMRTGRRRSWRHGSVR